MLGISLPFRKTAPLAFSDLISSTSGMRPVWNPVAAGLKLGDYGTVDKSSGAFIYEGNVLENSDLRTTLFPDGAETENGAVENGMTIVSKTGKALRPHENDKGNAGADHGMFKGGWEFKSGRGAVMVLHKPQRESLPQPFDTEGFTGHPMLKGKAVVKDVWSCPAYAMYLTGGGKDQIRLWLRDSSSTTEENSAHWHRIHGSTKGTFQSDGEAERSESAFTVLYTLKDPKRKTTVKGLLRRIRKLAKRN